MKLLTSSVVIVCLLALWWYGRNMDRSLAPTAATPMTVGHEVAGVDPAMAPPAERLAVDEVGEPAAIVVEAPSLAKTRWSDTPADWEAVIRVVDGDKRPVADAVVVDEAARDGAADGKTPAALLTDAEGRVRLSLKRSFAKVSATKGEQSSDARNLSQREHEGKVVELVLDAPVVVRGVVLSAAGVPVAGAWVEARRSGLSSLARRFEAPEPELVQADLDGRFAIGLWFGHSYSLTARRDGEWTLPQDVWLHGRQPDEVTLRFPGAITIAGLVVDAAGDPVGDATVRGWREVEEGDTSGDYELLKVTSDGDGAFSIPVKRHARYQLLASSEGRGSSEPVWFEPSEARPHVTGTLRLVELTTIAGVVVRDDGSPFALARVMAAPMKGGRRGLMFGPDAEDRFGRPDGVTTGEDGRFAFEVHPGTTWRLRALPPELRDSLHAELRDVAPGTRDVTIRITAADLAGCVVHGRVRRADGGAVDRYRVQMVYYYDDGSRSGVTEVGANVDGLRFSVGPLALGQEYGLLVSLPEDRANPAAAAPAYVGPFRADAGQLQFDFVLPAWAELPVRVVDASGAPAREVTVSLWSSTPQRGIDSPRRVDDHGVVVLQRRVPGRATLHVYGASSQLLEQEVTLTPGPNAEVVLRLPASSGR